VSLRDIADVLADRSAHAGLVIPEPLASQLAVYYEVLTHWNRRINLTALSDRDEAVDRLLLEPIAAATALPHQARLIDLGSGGGSPAIPLSLATNAKSLVMVESRVRKAAFLREALRELGVDGQVETRRFEDLAADPGFSASFGTLSVRAVRLDSRLFASVAGLLEVNGIAALFRSVDAENPPQGLPASLEWVSSRQLIPASRSALTLLRRST